jgi:dTDP-glucose 4,6-dehydratase
LYRIIPRTILFIRLGRKLPLHGGGHVVRSFVHVRDVADGVLRLARYGRPPDAYHLSTQIFHSIRDVVEIICRKLNVDFDQAIEIVGERPGNDGAYLLNSGRARNDLGWTETIGLEQGLDETIAWVDQNLDVLKQQPFDYIHKP